MAPRSQGDHFFSITSIYKVIDHYLSATESFELDLQGSLFGDVVVHPKAIRGSNYSEAAQPFVKISLHSPPFTSQDETAHQQKQQEVVRKLGEGLEVHCHPEDWHAPNLKNMIQPGVLYILGGPSASADAFYTAECRRSTHMQYKFRKDSTHALTLGSIVKEAKKVEPALDKDPITFVILSLTVSDSVPRAASARVV